MTAAHHDGTSAAIWLYVAASTRPVTPGMVRHLFPDKSSTAIGQTFRQLAMAGRLKLVGSHRRAAYVVTLDCEVPTRVTVREVLRGYGVGLTTEPPATPTPACDSPHASGGFH